MQRRSISLILVFSFLLLAGNKWVIHSEKRNLATPAIAMLAPAAGKALAFATSKALIDLGGSSEAASTRTRAFDLNLSTGNRLRHFATTSDGALAKIGDIAMPPPSLSFDGLSSADNVKAFGLLIAPPDTTGDV